MPTIFVSFCLIFLASVSIFSNLSSCFFSFSINSILRSSRSFFWFSRKGLEFAESCFLSCAFFCRRASSWEFIFAVFWAFSFGIEVLLSWFLLALHAPASKKIGTKGKIVPKNQVFFADLLISNSQINYFLHWKL
ncbi:hypothetical protein MFC_01284 [Mesomycoplasma flocculare ATCC 27716]|nr:hypothetical protein MFC_01284 [Mesomycoplasma flocculare ATCC 27716]